MIETTPKPIKLFHSILLFGIPAILLWFATHYGIDFICGLFGMKELLGWIIMGGLVFVLLFIMALVGIKREGIELNIRTMKKRFRLNPMTKQDWEWTFLGLMFVIVSSALIVYLKYNLFHTANAVPSFLDVKPLQADELWILGIWLVMFFFNIFGEELLWRGYILPRQQLSHGNYAWVINALLWVMFHFSFGLNLIINMLPLLFIIPYLVQKRNNTWIGIILHAAVNGPAFIIVSLSTHFLN